jgi:outer membrane protein assembly factor BamB
MGKDGTLYVGGYGTRLPDKEYPYYALDPATGDRKWTLELGGFSYGGAAIAKDGVLMTGVSLV